MAAKPYLIFAGLFFVTIAISCKKSISDDKNSIVGIWQLEEYYAGYVNGGNFKWNRVPPEGSDILKFSSDGIFMRIDNREGDYKECNGIYKIQSIDSLKITTSCNVGEEHWKISGLTRTFLVIDNHVREGVIKYKYKILD